MSRVSIEQAQTTRILWHATARQRDLLLGLGIALVAFCLYAATLLPGIGSGDTAEFQRVAPTLDVAHPTGYPLYTLLGWLWSQLPLGGTPAWRMNLFSALTAALAIGTLYLTGRTLDQRPAVAAGSALALAASLTFWSQATIAEVYALAALLQALLILALLRWRAGRWPFWSVGLLLGLGLAHHRTIVLMVPGLLLFVALSHVTTSLTKKDLAAALAALLAGCLLYLYLPLRAPPWLVSWRVFWQHVAGSAATSADFSPAQLWTEGAPRLLFVLRQLIWPQLLPIGALLALLGAYSVARRDRALAALLLVSYLVVFCFGAAYFVDDVDVFLIPAHLIAALLLGEGAMLLLSAIDNRRLTTDVSGDKKKARKAEGEKGRFSFPRPPWSVASDRWSVVGWLLLALPALLVSHNLSAIRAANTSASEQIARRIMAQPLPHGALLVVDWEATEGLRYLQSIEGLRPDLEVRPLNTSEPRQFLFEALAQRRAVYLLRPWPELGLAEWPEGALWRVRDQPPSLEAATAAEVHWSDGITLAGYTLSSGPYRPGDIVPVTLAWQATHPPGDRYTLFVHLVAADGTVWGQHDREPAAAPTDQWSSDQRAVDLYGPVLNPATPPGRYRVVIGWYEFPSLRRLLLANKGADDVTLGEIEVLGTQGF